MIDLYQPIVAWLVSAMSAAASPASLAERHSFGGWHETTEQRTARYYEIAQDAATVAFDPDERPLFDGPQGRMRTASFLLAIATQESAFAPDVDKGPCYRGAGWASGRCDHGRSACIMQINVGAGRTPEGWTKADLFADRTKCLRRGLHILRASFGLCPSRGRAHLLDGYAQGYCTETPYHNGLKRLDFARRFGSGMPALRDADFAEREPDPTPAEMM